MNLEEKIWKTLDDRALTPDIIDSIMAEVKDSGELGAIHWSEEIGAPGAYPLAVIATTSLLVDAIAFQYLKEHYPKHWAIDLFRHLPEKTEPFPSIDQCFQLPWV